MKQTLEEPSANGMGWLGLVATFLAVGCSSSAGGGREIGGALGSGGESASSGGALATGGSSALVGGGGVGGVSSSGGALASGGVPTTGGSPAIAGATATGGTAGESSGSTGGSTGGATGGTTASVGGATDGGTGGSMAAGSLPALHVEGPLIKDPNGKTIVLRGYALIDIGALYLQTNSAAGITKRIDAIAAAGLTGHVVRMPVYPRTDFNGGQPYYSGLPYPVGTAGKSSRRPLTMPH